MSKRIQDQGQPLREWVKIHQTSFLVPLYGALVTPELANAMHQAHNEAAHYYGDEGYGYEHELELAYLLEQPEFQAFLKSEAFQEWLKSLPEE